jgi:putative membrane-bound dehydrogenase-like protein
MSGCSRCVVALALLSAVPPSLLHAQKEYGFDNRKPSGQPYLPPEESVRRMKVADGFEVKLFAAEPMVINPIAMTVDEKGRVWVIESFEYPKRTPKGKMPRDRIVILEDTDGDGVADKRTLFAEGKDFPVSFDMASGLEVGNGGVYVGAPPYLFFIENNNDKPGKFEILLRGFGSQDTHETLNTFQWGPDGKLYGLHGVFTQSEVAPLTPQPPLPRRGEGEKDKLPPLPSVGEGGRGGEGAVKLNAGVWRYDTRAKKFEVFAEGTSNPWGLDWRNTDGQFILCCCVIPHLFHISPGGVYKRQAGQSVNPYAYGEIKEICDHTFHKESGWAHAGLIALDTPFMPKEYRDSVIFGSIHGCSIKRNVLRKNGSTYIASRADDFLQSGDKNFRPINLRWGPNGEIYCSDWHDQNPCHQAAPDSWDYEHGRVFRIQPKGLKTKKAEDLGKKTDKELARLVSDDNPYFSRTATRLLRERGLREAPAEVLANSLADLRCLWASAAADPTSRWLPEAGRLPTAIRAWQVRFLSEADRFSAFELRRLVELAREESAPEVQLELASAALRVGKRENTGPLLRVLLEHKQAAHDPVLPQMLWLGYEQKLIGAAKEELDWLKGNAAGNPLLTETIVPRAMRRLAATGKKEDLEACLAFAVGAKDTAVRRQALEGLVLAFQNRQVEAPAGWKDARAELLRSADADLQRLVGRLSVSFQDVEAIRRALGVARDTTKPVPDRIQALRDLALAHPAEALEPLLALLADDPRTEVRAEACRALAAYDSPAALRDIPGAVLAGWKGYPPAVRTEAVNLLAGRKEWARALLTAVGKKEVPPTDLTNNTILRIQAFKDKQLNELITTAWGRLRDTPADLNALIDKMRGELHAGAGSFERGRKVFENTCGKCHKFEGKGSDVGPELDGAARDIEYLLVNVLDPNRVVGAPYLERLVALKNGRVERGLLAAEDETSVTLKTENAAQKVIAKKDIDELTVGEKSFMPEGLAGTISVQDFRDLIRYVMAHPFLTDVALAGPFPADAAVKLDPDKPLTAAGVKWSKPVVGVPGQIALSAVKDNGPAVMYVTAEVTAPSPTRTRLLLGSGGTVRAWLDGKEVYQGKPGNGPATPDQAGVDVDLRQGTNRLLFRVVYQGDKEALYARLLDPQRRLKYPETVK